MKVPARLLVSRRRSCDRLGAALIVILACVVILTGLILAYLSHSLMEGQISASSASQARADLLARGAVDSVLGAFRQEIAAGSAIYAPGGSDVRDPNCLFVPSTNPAAVPYRNDPTAPANVVKRSAYTNAFFAGGAYDTADWPAADDAAPVSSTNRSYNGHSISLARWNAALLAPKAVPGSTNTAPVAAFHPPDWVYLNRQAQPVKAWSAALAANPASGPINTNYVVGRYAYVVYDEGGLLDANAAGYPSSVAAAMVRHKASQACADLTKIGLLPSDIDGIVQWRNPVAATSALAYTNYVYGGATNAFLTPAPGERLFTSRQQLIAFLTQSVAAGPADVARVQNALPCLTHFSRELNQPSWFPQTNLPSGGAYAYYDNRASLSTATNVFVPLARSGGLFTNSSGVTVRANQPVARTRFPLARLAWLGSGGVAGGATAAQVRQSFGLVWDPAFAAWQYVGGTPSTVQSSIETLAQVAGELREPNFFELLKAGILSGSLGGFPSIDSLPLMAVDSLYTVPDVQIVLVGLAILDQSNASALPARIEFGASIGAGALYGSKNLPYMSRLAFTPYRPPANPDFFNAWLEPVFWSPYQSGANPTAAMDLRVRLSSNSLAAGTVYARGIGPGGTVVTGLAAVTAGFSAGTAVTLQVSAGSAATLIQATTNPVLLSGLMKVGGATVAFQDNRSAPTSFSPAPSSQPETYTENGVTYAGFWLGEANAPNPPSPDAPLDLNNSPTNWVNAYSAANNTRIVLEANYGGAAGYQAVQEIDFGRNLVGAQISDAAFTTFQRRYNYYGPADPRTRRFGISLVSFPGYNSNKYSTSLQPLSADETNSTSWTLFSSPTQNYTGAIRPMPSSGTNGVTMNYANPVWSAFGNSYRFADNGATGSSATAPFYRDKDGAQRPGDGWWASATANTLPMRTDLPQYRPVLLGRPFASAGELGYAFRDMPWRSLDFGGAASADAGLLDLFCVADGYAGNTNTPVVAGKVDLNTRQPAVLAALLSGAARAELYPAFDVASGEADAIAASITNLTAALPLLNKSELATRLAPADPTVVTNAAGAPGIDTNIKERREALVRALAETGQVRTWNLMVDVIAQSGHFPPTAARLDDFVVDAERRCWAHVAIDRYTGQVVDIQIEPVSQ